MKIKKLAATLIALLSLTSLVNAQDAEEVVVTGLRANDYNQMPSVTFSKKADFLVQEVRLINDSRAPALRKSEIIDSIKNLLNSAKKIPGIALSYGDGFLVPLNLNDEALSILDDKKASDTSHIDISIKIAITENHTAKEQIAALKNFLKSANLVGRTLLEPQGDIGLSIIKPEQYRYQILALIAKENNKIKETFGANCTLENEGIHNRVEWDRVAVDELILFIRHSTKVECK